jgi:hypothetical protein
MWADPKYLRSWRDLRRRDLLFWFFVLSYVPGILLIIVVVNVLDHDAPEHIGIYFSAVWLAGFAGQVFIVRIFGARGVTSFSFVDSCLSTHILEAACTAI